MTTVNLIEQLVAEQLGKGDYTPDTTLYAAGCDSLDVVEVLMTAEDRLKRSLDEAHFNEHMTIQAFADEVDRQMALPAMTR